jgi:nicotinamidase-related amidase
MTTRIWDPFLTPSDREHVALYPARRKSLGERPVLLLVDLYRGAFGDEPEPLLESVKKWPLSCGLAGWRALPHIQRLLTTARNVDVPVIHLTGLYDVAGWREGTPVGPSSATEAVAAERRARRYEIVDELKPAANELVLRKSAPSAFAGTPLLAVLQGLGVDTIVVAGESTSGCVRATVVDARTYRYKVLVVEDCVFDRHEAAHAINLFDMDQKYADVVGIDEATEYLRRVTAPSNEVLEAATPG